MLLPETACRNMDGSNNPTEGNISLIKAKLLDLQTNRQMCQSPGERWGFTLDRLPNTHTFWRSNLSIIHAPETQTGLRNCHTKPGTECITFMSWANSLSHGTANPLKLRHPKEYVSKSDNGWDDVHLKGWNDAETQALLVDTAYMKGSITA